jgi:predicted RND superfamily exporter protein
MSVEGAILIWLAIGVGIAGGVFLVARTAVQMATVAYRVIEKQMDARTATRQTGLLSLAMLAALATTAVIAGYAILVLFASLLESGLSGN